MFLDEYGMSSSISQCGVKEKKDLAISRDPANNKKKAVLEMISHYDRSTWLQDSQ